MKGFDNHFENLTDYILKITYQIWEQKDVESIRKYYSDSIPVRSPSGVIIGPEPVVKATYATLNEFPDRQLLGEDVIWIGNDQEGYFSSHRILTRASHLKDGLYGKASNKKLIYRVIADCACRENQIYDEWLVRDQGAVVRQIGIDPKKYAENLIIEEGGYEKCLKPFSDNEDIKTNYIPPKISTSNTGAQYANILSAIMTNEENVFLKNYDRAILQEQPGGFTAHGHEEIMLFWNSLRSAFPNAIFTIEHISFNEETYQPKKAAIRWSLKGKHEGNGIFGKATNAEVYVMGICHAEFGKRGITREFVLFDETMIWKQILIYSG